MRWGLYDWPCPNLVRCDKVLIFVLSDCKSVLLQPSDMSSLPDGRSIACPIRLSLYILFEIQYLLPMLCVYRFLWTLCFGWLLVCCLYKEVYFQIFKCVSFWLHSCCGEWKGWVRKPVNDTSWVAVATPTDRPKSIRNCCVIELFVALFVLSLCPFHISAGHGVGAFAIGLSKITSFFPSLEELCRTQYSLKSFRKPYRPSDRLGKP